MAQLQPISLTFLQPHVPFRSLRSTDQLLLVVLRPRLKHRGEQAFACVASKLWNELPLHVRLAPTLPVFKSCHKTHFYSLVCTSLWELYFFVFMFAKLVIVFYCLVFNFFFLNTATSEASTLVSFCSFWGSEWFLLLSLEKGSWVISKTDWKCLLCEFGKMDARDLTIDFSGIQLPWKLINCGHKWTDIWILVYCHTCVSYLWTKTKRNENVLTALNPE